VGFFGDGEKRQADNEALQAEVARIGALPVKQLAVEVMTKGFGPGGPAAGGVLARPSDIAGAFIPTESSHDLDQSQLDTLYQIAVEGLQALEHAGLVRFQLIIDAGTNDNYNLNYTATRLGTTAL